MNYEKLLEIASWIAGIGSFIVAVFLIRRKVAANIKQKNQDGHNTIEVSIDREIESIEQKNINGDNKVRL